MYNIRLSSYTLSDLDTLLTINPIIKKLDSTTRKNLYNLAQESIAKLYSSVDKFVQLPPTTVSNNKLLFEASETQDTFIYSLGTKDLQEIRGSLFSFTYLSDLLSEHPIVNDLTDGQKKILFSLAQQEITNLRNSILNDEYAVSSVNFNRFVPALVEHVISGNTVIELKILNRYEPTYTANGSSSINLILKDLSKTTAEFIATGVANMSISAEGGLKESNKVIEGTSTVTLSITSGQVVSTSSVINGSTTVTITAHTLHTTNTTLDGETTITLGVT